MIYMDVCAIWLKVSNDSKINRLNCYKIHKLSQKNIAFRGSKLIHQSHSMALQNRVTSAPYRFPEQTPSQYHAKCASSSPRRQRAKSANSNISPATYDQFQKGSTVVQDEIWKSSCTKEKHQQMIW